MSSSCKGSDDTVFGGRGGTGIVADIEVGMCRFSVDGCGFVGVYRRVSRIVSLRDTYHVTANTSQ